jgi:hypothetical protein
VISVPTSNSPLSVIVPGGMVGSAPGPAPEPAADGSTGNEAVPPEASSELGRPQASARMAAPISPQSANVGRLS